MTAPQKEPAGSEREAFEAHASKRALRLDRDDGEGYRYIQTDEAWAAWQARASQPSIPADEVCATCNGHGLVGGLLSGGGGYDAEDCQDCKGSGAAGGVTSDDPAVRLGVMVMESVSRDRLQQIGYLCLNDQWRYNKWPANAEFVPRDDWEDNHAYTRVEKVYVEEAL